MDNQATNFTTGENGSLELTAAGVGDALAAAFFKLTRGAAADTVATLGKAVGDESLVDLALLTFQTRATRGMGKGEKMLFYQLFELLPKEVQLATVSLLPHYGYFKDFFLLLEHLRGRGNNEALEAKILELVCEQLKNDASELERAAEEKRTPKLSLCAKFAPREGGHFDKKGGLKLPGVLATKMFGAANKPASQRKYRQLLSQLNAALNTTEVLMASDRWAEIEFSRVASLCLQRNRKAFLNEALKGRLAPEEEATGNRSRDAGRIAAREHCRAALVSKKGVKGKALQPHEIAKKCMAGRQMLSTAESDLMGAQWTSLREGVKEALAEASAAREAAVLEAAAPSSGLESLAALQAALPKHVDLGRLVPLVDVSGSMSGQPMEAAIGLGILVSELTMPAFANRLLTFESKPAWVDLSSCKSIAEKVRRTQSAGWGGSTDFEAACEQILGVAERAKLKPDEVPDLIVFSDMQFDEARGRYGYGYGWGGEREAAGSWETHFERLRRRFAEVGVAVCGEPYAPPRIVFWNLRGDTAGFPVQADAPNTQMLSGFSPSLLKLVLTGADLVAEEKEVVGPDGKVVKVREGPTPAETVRKALDDVAFDPVRVALAGITEGPLAAYQFEPKPADEGFELVGAE